ncbi:MAG: hypothetical protein P8H36_02730 [Yoonia sp.]|nr:hypothetical protein [Yoonia sp.]
MIKPRHSRTSPRPWIEIFMALKGCFAVIAGVVAVFLTIQSVIGYRDAQRLANDGAWTRAQIVAQRAIHDDDKTTYYVTLRFDVASQSVRKERSVGSSYYRAHPVGSQVQVKYWTGGPKLFELREGQTKGGAVGTQWLALAVGIAALAAIWFPGRKTNAAVLSRRYGHRDDHKYLRTQEKLSAHWARLYAVPHGGRADRRES